MRAGRLDRRIVLERKTVTQAASGEPIETWSKLAERWASVAPAQGVERFSDPQLAARQETEFRVRWSTAIADLSPLDRIVYPAVDAGASPMPETSLYDIRAVHEIGRREGLRIVAERRPDVAG
jgi:head-tail adaptor